MTIPAPLDYPIIAITDVHGQCKALRKLINRLSRLSDWHDSAIVLVGDYVDRGPDVRGTLDLILELKAKHPGGVWGVMGNHDLALVRAARLDEGPHCAYWNKRYYENYDHERTFRSYLGRDLKSSKWDEEIEALREAMPSAHKQFLATLPWMVEASGHIFLHGGLSPELVQTAEEQVVALREQRWDESSLSAIPGTRTAELWRNEYPVWLGADKRLSDNPLPLPGRVQVTGHKPVSRAEANHIRIRLDTSGGHGDPLTACLLSGAESAPVFIRSGEREMVKES